MAVALDYLRCDLDGSQPQLGADRLFVFGLEMAEGSDGSGELADAEVLGCGVEAGEVVQRNLTRFDAEVLGCGVEAGEVALHFGVPEEELEAEGGGLGVDAVGAADDRSEERRG